jgi:hypothetical protein
MRLHYDASMLGFLCATLRLPFNSFYIASRNKAPEPSQSMKSTPTSISI